MKMPNFTIVTSEPALIGDAYTKVLEGKYPKSKVRVFNSPTSFQKWLNRSTTPKNNKPNILIAGNAGFFADRDAAKLIADVAQAKPRKNGPRFVKALATSGISDFNRFKAGVEAAAPAGFATAIQKPFKLEEMATTLENLIQSDGGARKVKPKTTPVNFAVVHRDPQLLELMKSILVTKCPNADVRGFVSSADLLKWHNRSNTPKNKVPRVLVTGNIMPQSIDGPTLVTTIAKKPVRSNGPRFNGALLASGMGGKEFERITQVVNSVAGPNFSTAVIQMPFGRDEFCAQLDKVLGHGKDAPAVGGKYKVS